MAFKSFFVHINSGLTGKLPNRKSRGATIHVSPAPSGKALVRASFCSPKDEFHKKIGREKALLDEGIEVSLREVPRLMALYANGVVGAEYVTESYFYYTLKRMV